MKSKIVKRKYITKAGDLIEKIYNYGENYKPTKRNKKRNKKTTTLVDKLGRTKKKAVEELKQKFINEGDIATAMYVDAFVEQAHEEKKGLTTRQLLYRVEVDNINKMFVNAGYTIEEAAAAANTTPEAIQNTQNWYKGGYFKDPNTGVVMKFDFNESYYGSGFSIANMTSQDVALLEPMLNKIGNPTWGK